MLRVKSEDCFSTWKFTIIIDQKDAVWNSDLGPKPINLKIRLTKVLNKMTLITLE